jgi:hypothetical protein
MLETFERNVNQLVGMVELFELLHCKRPRIQIFPPADSNMFVVERESILDIWDVRVKPM